MFTDDNKTGEGFFFGVGHKVGESLAKIETNVSLFKLSVLCSTDIQFYQTVGKGGEHLEYQPLVTADLNMTTVASVTHVSFVTQKPHYVMFR